MSTPKPRLAVVGGGIAGLAAAWEARDRADVTVFDPGPLGGKLRTEPFEGRPVDLAADAFLTRVPEAVALAGELGLTDDLVAPAAGQALVWHAGRLHKLPAELVLGAPRRVTPLLRTGLLDPIGAARAALDLVLPATQWGEDVSVYDLVARRFGRQVASRLVDPLVGSIHAGRTEELSAAATAPQLLAAARRQRSLMLALRHPPTPPNANANSSNGKSGPVFLAPSGGMQVLVDRMVTLLKEAGVRFEPSAVRPIEWGPDGLKLSGKAWDGVVLATPAEEAARLLGDRAPAGLRSIPTVSVTLVAMEYRASDLDAPAGTSGILVPRGEGLVMTACSFADTKWPQLARPGRVLLRVSAGRDGDDRHAHLDDDALVERLHRDLASVAGATGRPVAWRVSRWPASFPQYRVGHLARVADIFGQLPPGVAVAGASYQGVGVPACIASGRRAAASLVPR